MESSTEKLAKVSIDQIVRDLLGRVHNEYEWLSDAQGAQLEVESFDSSVRFCGEGSIDVSHMVSNVLINITKQLAEQGESND